VVRALAYLDGRLLLMRRHPGASFGGMWELPGGKVDADEDLVEALQRELEEESGLRVIGAPELVACTHRAAANGRRLVELRYQMRPSAPGFSPVVKGRSGRSPDQRGRSCCSMHCRSTDSGAPPTDPAK